MIRKNPGAAGVFFALKRKNPACAGFLRGTPTRWGQISEARPTKPGFMA